MAIVLNDSNFDEVVLKSELPVMVDFWAVWCAPCRAIAPYVEQIATECEGRAIVAKADIEQCPDISGRYGIRNVPTILFFKDGKVVNKHVGLASKKALADLLNALL